MTHTEDEALKLALDDLIAEYHMETSSFAKRVDEIFKQALAAPVQPVAWAEYHYKKGRFTGLTTNDINAVDSVGDGCQWVPQLQALAQPAVQEPVAWHDKIKGMEVSMDVSTGDDDIDHRVYGQVYEVILAHEAGPDVILAIESERNFTTPPAAQPPAQPAPVQPIGEVIGRNEYAGLGQIKHVKTIEWFGEPAPVGTKLYTAPPAPAQPAVQEPVAYLFTNVQSGDIESSTDPDYKEGEREMWFRERLVRPAAQPAAPDAIRNRGKT